MSPFRCATSATSASYRTLAVLARTVMMLMTVIVFLLLQQRKTAALDDDAVYFGH
jgi:hypothetical protein